jgi:exopolyphosphatase/guanosine-5'-triphosphate,3'-diphosphate pyrophosphatase
MALRIAKNADDFTEAAVRQGTPVQVITGDEEARLGLGAVMHDPIFAQHATITVIDPGGHSTELTTATRTNGDFKVSLQKSVPVGALGLRDGPMGADSPDRAARLKAVVEIDEAIGLQFRPNEAGTAVALGATPTNLVTIRERITTWDGPRIHGQYLDYEEVSKAVAWMCEMSEADRANIVGLEKGREKTLHIGALILERFLSAIHVLGCYVSVRGWRHAMLDEDIYF